MARKWSSKKYLTRNGRDRKNAIFKKIRFETKQKLKDLKNTTEKMKMDLGNNIIIQFLVREDFEKKKRMYRLEKQI